MLCVRVRAFNALCCLSHQAQGLTRSLNLPAERSHFPGDTFFCAERRCMSSFCCLLNSRAYTALCHKPSLWQVDRSCVPMCTSFSSYTCQIHIKQDDVHTLLAVLHCQGYLVLQVLHMHACLQGFRRVRCNPRVSSLKDAYN